jgi:hypothetical protein
MLEAAAAALIKVLRELVALVAGVQAVLPEV